MTKQEWNDIEMLQQVAYYMLGTLYLFGFYNIRGCYIISVLIHCFGLCCFKNGSGMLNSIEDMKGFYLVLLLPILFVIFAHNFNLQTEKDYRKKSYVQNRFKKIMDKSCEGILVMNEKSIEYMNNKFIDQ